MGSPDEIIPARPSGSPEPPPSNAVDQLLLFEVVTESSVSEEWSAPVPHPKTLAAYRDVDPAFPSVLIGEFQRNGDHRRKVETISVWTESITKVGGMLTAAGLAAFALYGGYSLIQAGKDATGLTMMISALASLVGVFVYGRRKTAEEPATVYLAEPDPATVTTNEHSVARLRAGGAVKR